MSDRNTIPIMLDLRRWTATLSGASLPKISIRSMLKNREIGRRGGPTNRRLSFMPNTSNASDWPISYQTSSTSNTFNAFTLSEKANLVNRFLPNKWIDIDRLDSTLFRCIHLPEEKLVCIGQEKNLRLYVRRPPYYQFVYETHIPDDGFITDLACSTKCDQLAYVTSNACVFYCSLNQIDEGILRWNRFQPEQETLSRRREEYFSISYTMDDQYFVIGKTDGNIIIVGTDESTYYSFVAHDNDIKAICCSKANPSIFYSGCNDGFCKMWDYRTSNKCIPLATSSGNNYAITHIDSDSYDRYIVTTSGGVKFDIWDVRRFSENISFNVQQRKKTNLLEEISYFDRAMTAEKDNLSAVFWQAKFSPRNTGHRYVYCGSNIGRISFFDIITGEVVREFTKDYREVYDCSWHPNQNEIIQNWLWIAFR
ncbi:unnamed protein product [Acanthocheilonema viteae]|uniref:Uncharacterized protein n=1 Tax=Acanthocheilonema viteae TaxID=6277 RepID=A0A498SWN8_ACAVI|nr:unnamed protein product [Acanthocheilonema viteae]